MYVIFAGCIVAFGVVAFFALEREHRSQQREQARQDDLAAARHAALLRQIDGMPAAIVSAARSSSSEEPE